MRPCPSGGGCSCLLCALSVLNTLDLDERGAWGGDALATLVAQVATPGE